jgi:hypothetical protein
MIVSGNQHCFSSLAAFHDSGHSNHTGPEWATHHWPVTMVPILLKQSASAAAAAAVCSEDYVGLVLYAKDGTTDWRCNGVHCQAGYIYYRKTSEINHIDSDYGQVGLTLHSAQYGIEACNFHHSALAAVHVWFIGAVQCIASPVAISRRRG